MKPALLIIDLQKAYYKDNAAKTMDAAALVINRTIPLFRENGLPVIWVQHIDEYDGAVPGKIGFEFIDGLEKASDEVNIRKTYNDSFTKTELSGTLDEMKVDTVVLAGYCAEYCIMASYWGAKNHDLRPYILRSGIASDVERNIGLVEEMTATKSLEEIAEIIKS